LKRALQAVGIVAVTVFFLWLFLKNANLHDVGRIIRQAHPGWLALALVINSGALVFRTIRWRTILGPENPTPFYPAFFANAVGYMLSTVLPIRAADVARPALLSRRTETRFSNALGTVLTERILDLVSLLSLFTYFVLRRWREFHENPATAKAWDYVVRPAAIASAATLAALFLFMIGLYFRRATVRRLHEWIGKIVPRRFRSAWMNFFDAFAQSLELVEKPSALILVLLSTAGVWFCLTAQFTCTTFALNMRLPFDASFFVTAATTLGLAVPTPGGIGGMHKVCQYVLTAFYAVSVDMSVAAAVLFHLVGSLPVVVIGVALFIAEGLHWRDLPHA